MDKYGFVYKWYDQKHNRYYIGCHWGTDFDGYICSSNWMRNSYRKRPEDFTREILKTNILSKEETLDEEYKWLQIIHPEELGKRYYNLRNCRFPINEGVVWNKGKSWSEEAKEKMRQAKINNPTRYWLGKEHSEESKEKMSQSAKEHSPNALGYQHTEESKEKMSQAKLGKVPANKGKVGVSEETSRKMSEATKNHSHNSLGHKHTEEAKEKMKAKRSKQVMKPWSEERRKKIQEAWNKRLNQ